MEIGYHPGSTSGAVSLATLGTKQLRYAAMASISCFLRQPRSKYQGHVALTAAQLKSAEMGKMEERVHLPGLPPDLSDRAVIKEQSLSVFGDRMSQGAWLARIKVEC
ncbi:hypothetical protein DPEC_G00359090 [Dallia pectoralis]|uniref:Uncharacterized protein n=1 Tax=Dallia pectoralis TaxID=75939 RepID=A0ACC2F0E5_DALPE|nr:hypothetical protein DPEC_G00359090 [Dallia pectoralis]